MQDRSKWRGGIMKKTVAFIVLVALLLNCTYTAHQYLYYERMRPLVISNRVGETIEPNEREQFGLFHGIDDFKSATFYSISHGGYEVEIITEDFKLVAINRDFQAVAIVRDYINRYDEIQESQQSFEKKWRIADYDDLGFPITHDEVSPLRRRYTPYLFGASCCLLGYFPSLYIGGGIGWSAGQEEGIGIAIGVLVGGLIASTVIGLLTGYIIDRNKPLKAIKEARKPRIVE